MLLLFSQNSFFWNIITVWDLLLLPLYVGVIFLVSVRISKSKRETEPIYKYYSAGILAKLGGAMFFALVYTLAYEGGDTINYYESAVALINLAGKDLGSFFSLMAGNLTSENYSHFDMKTGYPLYYLKPNSFAMVRISVPFVFLGFKSYFLSTMLLAWAAYTGVWKIAVVFAREFPRYTKHIAFGVLFVPSVLCWGSGLMKDSVLLAALGWFVYAFHCLVKRLAGDAFIKYIVVLVVTSYLMLMLKAFNLYAIGACAALWFIFEQVGRIKNSILKVLVFPLVTVVVLATSMAAFTFLSSLAGGYFSSVTVMLERAVIIQQDLIRDAYGTNSFDIGVFEPTIWGILKKAPLAIEAGLFRPYPWEVRNALMGIQVIENLFLLGLTLFVVFRIGPVYTYRRFVSKPYIIMLSLVFSVVFAFSVGLITANFGALVRYKIPLVPFYVTALLMIYCQFRDRKLNAS